MSKNIRGLMVAAGAGAILTLAMLLTGCTSAHGAERLPQSTLKALPLEQVTLPPLPQTTLDCPCPVGGKCQCPPGQCQCPGCACTPKCPGLVVGQSKSLAAGITDATKHRCPLVVFVNTAPRSVPGAVCCRDDGKDDKRPRIVVWTPYGGSEELSAKVSDADIQESIGRCSHAKLAVSGLHSHRCGMCGTVWSHGSESYGSVAAHQCPKCGCQSWQPIPYVAPRAAYLPASRSFCST